MEKILRCWQRRGFLFVVFLCGITLIQGGEAKAGQRLLLAMVPFFAEVVQDPAQGAVCPVCQGPYTRGSILSTSRDMLTQLLYKKMETRGTFDIIPLAKVEEVLSNFGKRQVEEKPVPTSLQAGKELGADFVFVGYLFRFEERVGSSLGAEKPASVGFHLHLFRLRDRKMVWVGKMDETQRPLSEDLLRIGSFLRRKAMWLTAEELAGVGMDEMLNKLPGVKELEEGS